VTPVEWIELARGNVAVAGFLVNTLMNFREYTKRARYLLVIRRIVGFTRRILLNVLACYEIKLEISEVIGTVNGKNVIRCKAKNGYGSLLKIFSYRAKETSQLEPSSATHRTDKESDSALEGANWITENANSIDFIHGQLSLAIYINWFLDNSKINIEFNSQV